jgi:hypothetical protein
MVAETPQTTRRTSPIDAMLAGTAPSTTSMYLPDENSSPALLSSINLESLRQ